MATNDATIRRRVAAREQARACAALVVEEAGRVAPEAQNAFWDEIHKMLPATADTVAATTAEQPMTDRQSIAFGRTRIPFGQHVGERVDDAPIAYLERLCDPSPSPFIQSLRRYLASQRIEAEKRDDA